MSVAKQSDDVTLPAGRIKRLHINSHTVKRCVREKVDEPCVIVKLSDARYYGRSVEIKGESHLIQSLDKPMPGCGARIWIETTAEVVIRQATVAPVCELAA